MSEKVQVIVIAESMPWSHDIHANNTNSECHINYRIPAYRGCRCGLVVSRVLSFKSDDPYSNPVAGRIICLMEENMTKSPGVPLLIGSILEL